MAEQCFTCSAMAHGISVAKLHRQRLRLLTLAQAVRKRRVQARCCCAFTNFSMHHSLEWLNLVWLFVVLLSMAVSHQLLQLHHILHENNLELPSCGCVSLLRTHKTLNHKKTTSVGGFKVSIVSILEKASFQSFDSSRDNILT